MIRIAVCDDEYLQRSTLQQYVKQYVKQINIKIDSISYKSGEDLLKAYKSGIEPFHIIILDIFMEQLNGMDTAKYIRQYDTNVIILFLTSSKEFVYDGYLVSAFRYLLKPLKYDSFEKELNSAITLIESDEFIFVKTKEHDYLRVKVNDILYFESQKRELRLVTKKINATFYGKISDYYNDLSSKGFIRPHQSYLVQMNYIEALDKNNIELTNGDYIPVSKHRRKKVFEIYFDYIRKLKKNY